MLILFVSETASVKTFKVQKLFLLKCSQVAGALVDNKREIIKPHDEY